MEKQQKLKEYKEIEMEEELKPEVKRFVNTYTTAFGLIREEIIKKTWRIKNVQ